MIVCVCLFLLLKHTQVPINPYQVPLSNTFNVIWKDRALQFFNNGALVHLNYDIVVTSYY